MTRRGEKIGAMFVVLVIGLAFSMLAVVAPEPIRVLRIITSNLVFGREDAPLKQLAPAPSNIVLVLFDDRTRLELGVPPEGGVEVEAADLDRDLHVYQWLVDHGARMVLDTRRALKPTPQMQEMLERLAGAGLAGRVARDLWPELGPWFKDRAAQYAPFVAHNLFSVEGFDEAKEVRYYHLLLYLNDEVSETMALRAARALLDVPPGSPGAVAVDSGIIHEWVRGLHLSKDELRHLPAQALAERSPRPYRFAPGRAIPWVSRPSIGTPRPILPAAFIIDFAPRRGSYTTLSYADVLAGRASARPIDGALAVIGGERDTYATPASSTHKVSAAEIVADAVETIVAGRFHRPEPLWVSLGLIWVLSCAGGGAFAVLRPWRAALALLVVLVLFVAAAVVLQRAGFMVDLLLAPSALVAAAAATGGYRYAREEVTRRRIYDLFGRYVPRSVVAELLQRPFSEALAVGGTKREVSVLFADVRGFTRLSEGLPSEEVLRRLNGLLRTMVDCAFRHGGTVDKFIGDAVMVVFNAPLDQPDHVVCAVRTALDMQQAASSNADGLALGIGVHTGEATAGNVGTPERMEYTVIGRTVNLASRLCDSAAPGEVVISSEVRDRLGAGLVADARPPLRAKGIDRELLTYLARSLDGPRGAGEKMQ